MRESAAHVYNALMHGDPLEWDEEAAAEAVAVGASHSELGLSKADRLLLLPPTAEEFFGPAGPGQRPGRTGLNKLIQVQGAHGRLDLALETFARLDRRQVTRAPEPAGACRVAADLLSHSAVWRSRSRQLHSGLHSLCHARPRRHAGRGADLPPDASGAQRRGAGGSQWHGGGRGCARGGVGVACDSFNHPV